MGDMKTNNEYVEKLKEKLEEGRHSRKSGMFERYNDDILQYLRNKFPNEPVSSIQEAASYIAYKTAVVVMDMQDESNQALMKTYSKMYQFVFEAKEVLKK